MEVTCDESHHGSCRVFMQNIYLAALSGFRMAFSAAMAVEHHDNMVEGLVVDMGGTNRIKPSLGAAQPRLQQQRVAQPRLHVFPFLILGAATMYSDSE